MSSGRIETEGTLVFVRSHAHEPHLHDLDWGGSTLYVEGDLDDAIAEMA